MPGGSRAALAGLLLVAALVRFVGIDSQSLWLDEVVTAELVNRSFGDMLSTIPRSESTPYLYYVLLWPWAQLFGDEAGALRALSALFGVGTVAAIWAGARTLVSERAALAAAALAAVNPLLIWYAQEARAYALLALLCAVGFWCFARALRDPRWIKWWALASVLAFATHYFAAFTILPEAVVLAWMAGRTRVLAIACAAIGAVGLAHLPLVLEQRRGGGANWIDDFSLGHRIAEIPKRFTAGEFGNQLGYIFWPVLICALVAGVLLVLRTVDRERRGGLLALAIGAAALALPMAVALVAVDYVFARNLIGALPVLLIVFAAGLTASRARRAGAVVLAVVCALSVVALWRIAADDALQRDDWRAAVGLLDRSPARAIVVSPAYEARTLRWYRGELGNVIDPGILTGRLAIVGLTRQPRGDRSTPKPPPGFRTVEVVDHDTFRFVLAESPQELVLNPALALGSALNTGDAAALIDPRR